MPTNANLAYFNTDINKNASLKNEKLGQMLQLWDAGTTGIKCKYLNLRYTGTHYYPMYREDLGSQTKSITSEVSQISWSSTIF